MYALLSYQRVPKPLIFSYGSPIDSCKNEADIDEMVKNHLQNSSHDYIEAENPSDFAKMHHGQSGYVVVKDKLKPEGSADHLRRWDEFSLINWRKNPDNERKLCELLGIVCRL